VTRLAVLLLGCALLAPACGGPDRPADGTVVVTVTLSRSGPPGPSLDHVPQPGVRVEVGSRSARTDADGVARLAVPPGTYAVIAVGCPDAPHRLRVTAGERARTTFDCLAA
jgi:hypothetical protein